MQYMHLTTRRVDEIINPYDALVEKKDTTMIPNDCKRRSDFAGYYKSYTAH